MPTHRVRVIFILLQIPIGLDPQSCMDLFLLYFIFYYIFLVFPPNVRVDFIVFLCHVKFSSYFCILCFMEI